MTPGGADPVVRHGRLQAFWAERRARWTLPLVIIVVIVVVAVVDHVGSHRISEVDQPAVSQLVTATGGSAVVDLGSMWDGFNPGTPGGASSSTPALMAPVLPSAFTVDPKFGTVLNTALLRSVEVTSTTPLTVQYVLDPRAVWSDGVPVSAADFIYAWQSQRGGGVDVNGQPDRIASTLGYRDIASVTGGDGGKTVTVVFAKPFTDWRLLFHQMVPAHVAERVGWNRGFATFDPSHVLSAGPYILRSASPTGTAVLVRNPRWWGPKAVLDRVIVHAAQPTAEWLAALSRSSQTAAEPAAFGSSTMNAVSSLPAVQSTVEPSASFLQLEFDVTAPATSVTAVRQAIAHGIDRTALLAQTVGTIDPALVVDEDHLAVPTQGAYAASSAASEYDKADPVATAKLLASAGYHRAPDGRSVDASGAPLVLRMAVESGDAWIPPVAAGLVAQLAAVGITVVTVPVDGPAGLSAAAATNSYDMALVTRTASAFPTEAAGWYSDSPGLAGSGPDGNWTNFDDPEVDQLFAQAAADLNPVTGATAYAQADDQLWDQMVALPLFGEPALVANGVQLANVTYNPGADGLLWNLAEWTLLRPKGARPG